VEQVPLALPEREVVVPPVKWTAADVQAWMRELSGGRFVEAAEQLPSTMSGKLLTRWPVNKYVTLCGNDKRLGQKLFEAFRTEMQRAADDKAGKRQDMLDAQGAARGGMRKR
jgi:hypothetical protein